MFCTNNNKIKLLLESTTSNKKRKKPFLLKYRSSNAYVFTTASFSIFTGSIIYSIVIPILPFILDAMKNNISLDRLDSTSLSVYNNVLSPDQKNSFDAGVILGLYSAASVVTSPMFGYIGDKVKHRRTPMLFGILALLGTTFLFLFATHYWMLAMARVLQGISDACVYTLSLTLISDAYPSQVIGTQLGRVMLFQSIGMAAGAPIGGILFDKIGYRGPFIFIIVLAGIDFLLRLFLIERRNNPKHWFEDNNNKTISQHHPNNDVNESGIIHDKAVIATSAQQHNINNYNSMNTSHEKDRDSKKGSITYINSHHEDGNVSTHSSHSNDEDQQKSTTTTISMLQLLRDARILVALLFSLLPFLAISMLEPTLPIQLAEEWGYDSSQIGLIFLAEIIPSFLAVPLSGYLYDRYGAKCLCFLTLFLSTVIIACFGIPSNRNASGIAPLIVLVILFGFFINMIYTPAYAEVTHGYNALLAAAKATRTRSTVTECDEEEEDGSGRSYGLISTVVCIGNFAGPVLGGHLFETIGFFWLCISVACILLIFSPLALVFLGSKRFTFFHLSFFHRT
ncbi:major facilitator superfamily domain-containing protein [Phascolomyces articulosus]|uniref:Major facilitator superfamily domain-containing protein n=1 Tax=Phascolomyces articulosus TaxID=60185 RepID=A0AAD5K7Y7_9FUNG|nr:major facilitator superfamily domain-containing protein [Phascolomyces articulosus]